MGGEIEESQFERLGRAVHRVLTQDAPFGSLTKAELELALFTELVRAEIVDPDERAFRLAQALRCSPAKANSLVFNYRLRHTTADSVQDGLVRAIRVVKDAEAVRHRRVILNVEQRYWREVLVDELKNHGVFTDGSFNRERLTMDAKDFLAACEAMFGDTGSALAKAVRSAGRRQPAEVVQELVGRAMGSAASTAGSQAGAAVAGPTLELLANAVT